MCRRAEEGVRRLTQKQILGNEMAEWTTSSWWACRHTGTVTAMTWWQPQGRPGGTCVCLWNPVFAGVYIGGGINEMP